MKRWTPLLLTLMLLVALLIPSSAQLPNSLGDRWKQSFQDCGGQPCLNVVNATVTGPILQFAPINDLFFQAFQMCGATPCLTVNGAGGGGGSGTVTSVDCQFGLTCTPDPITAAGTIALQAPSAGDQIPVSDSTSAFTWKAVPDCTDTTGNHLNYIAATNTFSCGTSGSVTIPGADTQVLFNDGGALGADAGFVYNKTTNVGTLGSVVTSQQAGVTIGPFNTGAGQTGELRLAELAAGGTNYRGFKAPDALTGDLLYVLPTTDPTAGQMLTAGAPSGGVSVLSWTTETGASVSGVSLVSMTHPDDAKLNSTTADQDYTSVYTIPANALDGETAYEVRILYGVSSGADGDGYKLYLKLGSTKVFITIQSIPNFGALTYNMVVDYTILSTADAGASVNVRTSATVMPEQLADVAALNDIGVMNSVTQPVALATNGTLAIVPGVTFDGTGSTDTVTVKSILVKKVGDTTAALANVAYVNVANAWADGIKQTFNPDGTTAGLNVGSVAGDPSTPANGDLWYDSTANELTARINGANVALGAGGGGAPADATYITQTPNGTLSAEQALSSLSTGIMRVATATGIISSLTDSAGIAANISDETGSGALVFGTSPTLTTPTLSTPSLGTTPLTGTYTADATGITVGLIAKLTTASPATVTKAATNDTGILGIVVSGCGAAASCQVATRGQTTCTFENATTSNNLVGVGTGTAGDCRDLGTTNVNTISPTVQIIGRATETGAAGSRTMQLFGPGHYGTVSRGMIAWGGVLTLSADRYVAIGTLQGNATEGNVDFVKAGATGVCRNLAVCVATAPGAGTSWTVTLRQGAIGSLSNTALTVSIADTAECGTDTTNTGTWTAGNVATLFFDATGAPSAAGSIGVWMECDL